MSFQLAISARRDPAEPTARDRASGGSSCIATLVIAGVLSDASREELRQRLETLLASSAETVVIELADVGDQVDKLARFSEWVEGMRAEGKPLHVAAHQAHIYERLRVLGNDPEWLVPRTGAETAVNRRALSLEGPGAAG